MRGSRTYTREIVLQALHATEGGRGQNLREEFQYLLERRGCKPHLIQEALAKNLLTAIGDYRQHIIDVSRDFTTWQWSQLEVILRSIIIQGSSEMIARISEPRLVIDEYVTFARRYGGAATWRYANGVLDRLAKQEVPE